MITNIKIVLVGFYLPAYGTVIAQWMIAQGLIEEVQLTTLEMVMWASIISFVGGVSAAYRSSTIINDLLRSGLNTAVMGACLAFVSTYWTLDKPALAWLTIGLSGILSLGGLATVEWFSQTIRKRFGNEIEEVADDIDNVIRGRDDE